MKKEDFISWLESQGWVQYGLGVPERHALSVWLTDTTGGKTVVSVEGRRGNRRRGVADTRRIVIRVEGRVVPTPEWMSFSLYGQCSFDGYCLYARAIAERLKSG